MFLYNLKIMECFYIKNDNNNILFYIVFSLWFISLLCLGPLHNFKIHPPPLPPKILLFPSFLPIAYITQNAPHYLRILHNYYQSSEQAGYFSATAQERAPRWTREWKSFCSLFLHSVFREPCPKGETKQSRILNRLKNLVLIAIIKK